jgi:predicted small lipoprotein YifL
VFAAAVGEFAPSAALILNLPDGRRYVVVLADGLVYADYIDTENRVEESVRHVEVLYSNDTTTFPGESVSVEWLFEQAKAHPSYALKSIPLDRVAVAGMAAVALLACGLLGGLYFYNKKVEADKAAKELAAAQAADPTPVYMANLAMRRMQMMVPPAAWIGLYERVSAAYATAPGWIRVKVVCNVKGCVSTWARKGGNHPELTSFLKEQQEAVAPALSGALDAAQSTISVELKGVPGAATYPTPDSWLRSNVETIQNWKNARFSPTVGDFVLWPATPDIPPTFRTVGALNAAPINITVPGALLSEVLETTPAGVSWESMTFTLNAGGSPSERVTVQMTGVIYAALPN